MTSNSKEIERRFLVQYLPYSLLQDKPISIEQGYMAIEDGGNAVRLRRIGHRYFLTVKSSGSLVREEREVVISEAQFKGLWASTEGRRIVKDRYVIPYGSLEIEVDVFKGNLKGLIVAEVEFESVTAALVFQKLEWMSIEVTENPRFNNRYLQEVTSVEDVLKLL